MEIQLPWRLAKMVRGRHRPHAVPKPHIIAAINECALSGPVSWRGGILQLTWVGLITFERFDEVFTPIYIYGNDEDVVLLKLKYL
jgi:hypothetical protein